MATVEDSEGERVVGHVMLSGCRLDVPERLVAVYTLSPLGVLPEFQRSGIGNALIGHAMSAADAQGIPLVFLEGHARLLRHTALRQRRAAGLPAADAAVPAGRVPGRPAVSVRGLDARHPRLLRRLLRSRLRRPARRTATRAPTIRRQMTHRVSGPVTPRYATADLTTDRRQQHDLGNDRARVARRPSLTD
ncbi:GNAT family N-acetyltransferase [Micromonospora sp. URMC 103]|uniref:GNAT family N-acetyltransferase n=1 Tax=Micromonospora sp. URMC 103 TaxID=3423406 RepID=UPI003F1D6CA9